MKKIIIKDVELSLNSVEIGKSDKDDYIVELGPFMPGKYDLLASYKGRYEHLKNTYNIDFIKSNNDKVSLRALGNVKKIKITIEYADADIFGPISHDTRLYAVVTLDGKRLKSEEVKFYEGVSNLHLSFRNPSLFKVSF